MCRQRLNKNVDEGKEEEVNDAGNDGGDTCSNDGDAGDNGGDAGGDDVTRNDAVTCCMYV